MTAMKKTLAAVLESGLLLKERVNTSERKILERWAEHWANEPIWAEIVDGARKMGGWKRTTLNSQLIWYALDAKRIATSVKSGVDPVLLEERREREQLLDLADKADELSLYFKEAEKYIGIAEFFHLN